MLWKAQVVVGFHQMGTNHSLLQERAKYHPFTYKYININQREKETENSSGPTIDS